MMWWEAGEQTWKDDELIADRCEAAGVGEPGARRVSGRTGNTTGPLKLFLSSAYCEKKHNLGDKGSENKMFSPLK